MWTRYSDKNKAFSEECVFINATRERMNALVDGWKYRKNKNSSGLCNFAPSRAIEYSAGPNRGHAELLRCCVANFSCTVPESSWSDKWVSQQIDEHLIYCLFAAVTNFAHFFLHPVTPSARVTTDLKMRVRFVSNVGAHSHDFEETVHNVRWHEWHLSQCVFNAEQNQTIKCTSNVCISKNNNNNKYVSHVGSPIY